LTADLKPCGSLKARRAWRGCEEEKIVITYYVHGLKTPVFPLVTIGCLLVSREGWEDSRDVEATMEEEGTNRDGYWVEESADIGSI